jgi:hypothetical protein
MYASAQQESTEDYFNERILKGLKLSAVTADKLQTAKVRGNICYLDNMHIVATWNKSTSGFKQRGVGLALADEVSSWGDYGVIDIFRKRMDTFTFPHMIIISSPDATQKRPSDEDPIFIEFEETDQRYWHMPDPVTGNEFRFVMGGNDVPYGLKWDKTAKRDDGTWDLNKVADTAHYVTPDGSVITNDMRRPLICKGRWIPTNSAKARKGKVGYHLNQFHVPFSSGDFGHIAVKFLEAKEKGERSLRVFAYEVLAEKFASKYDQIDNVEVVYQRKGGYNKGQSFAECDNLKQFYIGKKPIRYGTIDVQKYGFWWVCREWIKGGDSGLIDFGYSESLDKLDVTLTGYKVHKVYIDNSYAQRQQDIREECYLKKMIPAYGREHVDLYARMRLEPVFEGVKGDPNAKIGSFTWKPSIFKHILMDMMRGESVMKWYVCDGIDRDYVKQVMSESCVDGNWVVRKGYSDNHLWDCECLQVLAATIDGLHRIGT